MNSDHSSVFNSGAIQDSWVGSVEPQEKGGTATYRMDGDELTLRLANVREYLALGDLLRAAYQCGRRDEARATIQTLSERLNRVTLK